MNKSFLLFITFSLLVISNIQAANRYWIATSGSNWNNTSNWSTSSGGSGGASVPTTGDFVYFNIAGQGNCTLDVPAAFDGINITSNYSGIVDLGGFSFNPTASGSATCNFRGGIINDTPGTSSINYNTSGQSNFEGTNFNTAINIISGRVKFSGGTFNNSVIVEDNGSSSTNGNGGCTFNSTLKVTNSGTSYFLMGVTNPDIFNGDVTFINNSTSRMRIAYSSTGNQFNGNIKVGSIKGQGIYFGENGGQSTLASTKTISVDAGGFITGDLRLKNFIQIGATPQIISLSGSSRIAIQSGSIFDGNVNITSPRITLTGTQFSGTSSFEKTGSGNDYSAGGNTFVGNCILTNSSTNQFIFGNGSSDAFNSNLIVNNTGSSQTYIAHNSAGNTIGGALTVNNTASSGTSTYVYLSQNTTSSLTVGGAAVFNNNTSAANGRIYIGDNGDITFNSSITIQNNASGTNGYVLLGNNTNSTIIVSGAAIVQNSGAGTTKRIYLGNQGDVAFNSTLNIENTSSANNSEIFLNDNINSTNLYNSHIVVSNSHASGDGVFFGNNGGTATLANSKTITIGGAGFIAGQLRFRNFTQLGSTPQSILLSGTALLYNYGAIFGGNVSFTAPRIITRTSTYNGTSYFEKTGASNDASVGGNTFIGNTELKNNSSNYFLMGNGSADDFQGNLILNNTGTNHMYLAYNSPGNSIAGSLTVNNNNSGTSSHIYLSTATSSTLTVGGITSITNSGSATHNNIYAGGKGTITFNNNVNITNNGSGTNGHIFIATDSSSNVTINGSTIVTNSGSGGTKRIYLGNQGDIIFNGTLKLTNSASATNSQIYLNNSSNSHNTYNDHIVIESTNAASDGIRFGDSQGSGTLANTKTITVGVGGFIAGNLNFRNFTQTGNTAQSITLTGTGYLYSYNSSFGGDILFKAPRFNTRGTVYSGTTYFEKSGGIGDDQCAGGNTLTGNTTIVNSGSKSLAFGYGNLDNYLADVDLINSGTNTLYFARSGAGHSVAGNLNVINSATGTGSCYVIIGNNATSTLTVGGNVSLLTNGSANQLRTYFVDNGIVTVGGNLNIQNSGSGSYSVSVLANTSTSSLIVQGNTNVINNNNASTRNRVILGNYGDVTFNGTLNIENLAGTTDSEVFCNYNSTSSNVYNDHITVSSKHISSDGVLFGYNNGSGTLATSKTITIPGVDATNFIGGRLHFRNFTQTGNTPHSFELGSTASYIYSYGSNWEGNVSFISPRIYIRTSVFNGTSYFEKNGSSNDDFYGGNTFTGNTEFVLNNNVGTGRMYLAGGLPNTYGSNVILRNIGAFSDLLMGNAAGTYTIPGNITLINQSTGTGSQQVYLSNNNSSIFNITGNLTLSNDASGTSGSHNTYIANRGTVNISGNVVATNSGLNGVSKNVYLGNSGSITIGGNLDMTNSSTAATAQFVLANNSTSSMTINGVTTLTNNGNGSNKQCYIGNYGDVIFNNDLNMVNTSSASYSQIYLNNRTNSSNQYNGNITVKSTHTSCAGFLFGSNGGNGTLAASKTVSIPGVDVTNYIGGVLSFRNFTQLGNTPQSFELGTTASYFVNYNSNWGGNVSFKAPRISTRGTIYNGTSHLEKSGANSDASAGGNIFIGNTELKNTGSGYLLMGSGTSDTFQANLTLNNNSSHNIYLAYNSSGNTVGGNLTVNHNTTSGNTYTYLANATASTLTVSGSTTLNNNSSANVGYIVLGDNGDVTLNGSLNIVNNGSTNNGHILVANNGNSLVTVNGLTSVINSSAGTYRRIYIGNYGDVVFNNNLNITNNSNATYSEIFLNNNSNSTNQYNGNVLVESVHASSDGVRFGQSGGNGILANTKTIGVGGGGFIAGQLLFRNFTQTGSTTQNIILTGSGYLYLRNSIWSGTIDFRAPRVFTSQTTYHNVTSLEKTGSADDASTGNNTFNNNVTFKNSGTGYFMPSNGQGNDFNGNVTYYKVASGNIYPSYNSPSTYAKDITVNASSTLRFGAASHGRTIFDGSSPQSINIIGGTPSPEFRDIQTSNNFSEITLNTPITILKELDLDNGNLISTSTNVIYMNDNSNVSSVSNSAFVDGPLIKIGNDAFTFPVGNSGFYAPISMSNPSSSSSRFEGQYVHTAPQIDGFDTTSISSGLDHISSSEYWILNRLVGSNNVKTTIGWENTRSGNIGAGTRCDIRIARWNGTKWINEGNGGITGSAASGSVISGSNEDCVTSSNVTSWTNGYPITLAIDSNYITWDGTAFDGGSGSGNAPDNSDAGRILKVYGPSAVITSDASLSQIIVTAAGELTINNNVAVSVSEKINNNGFIQVENNGSIIQTNSGANENSGSGIYKIKREGNNFANSYNIWSSPIQNASLVSTFSGTNPCDIWLFDHTSQTWNHDYAVGFSTTCYGNPVTFTATDVIAGGDGIMDEARGYFVPGAAASTRLYDGEINNGSITKPVVTTSLGNNPSWDQDDWNLLGNPYPSALSAADFWTENAINNSRITDAVYFWDGGDTSSGYNQHSDYASWNALGGVNSGNSGTIPSGHIASGQGFWVYASSNSNVVFDNSMRTGNNNQYFKTESQNDNHLAWISVTSPQNYQNNILVGYNDITTDSIDPSYDAHKFVGSSHIRFATMIGNEEFSIQAIKALNVGDSKVIPLALFTADSGNHVFNNYKTQNLPSNIKVYIKDLDNGLTQDLTQGDYTVSLLGNVEYLNRFELVFKNEIGQANGGKGDKGNPNTGDTTVTDINPLHINDLYKLQRHTTGYMLSHPDGINGDIQVLDVTGKVIWTQTNLNGNTNVFINLNNMSTGIYFLNIVNDNRRLYNSKIIKN